MPRTPKPWFDKERKVWKVTINGQRHNLGKRKKAAMDQFHRLMTQPADQPRVSPDSLAAIVDAFLDWNQKHRAPDTYEWYRLQRFIERHPDITVSELRPYHAQEWADSYDVSRTSKRNHLRAIKRSLSWAKKQGYIDNNPIEFLELPAQDQREVLITEDQYESVLDVAGETLRDLIVVTWETGWRRVSLPFEGRWLGTGVGPELVKLAKKFIDRGYVEDAHRYAANYSTQLKGELDYSPFLVNLGNTLLERGQINRAIPHYRKAIAHKPDSADAYCNLGLALQAQGNLGEATASHRRALQLNPQLTVAHVELGRLQSAQGNLRRAVRHYRDALAVDPDHIPAHGNLGNTLLRLRQVDKAINHFRQVLAIDEEDAIAHYNLGRALAGRGKLEEAVRHFRRSLEIRPDNARIRKMLAMSLKKLAESASERSD